jgi:hypothetical protein
MLQQEVLLINDLTQFLYLCLVLASFLLESSYHFSGFLQCLSYTLHLFNSVSIDLVSIEHTFSHHPSVGVVHGFWKEDWGDKIKAMVRVALGWEDSFTLDTRYSVSLKYRNYFGCRPDYLVREQPFARCQWSSVLVPYTPTLPKQDWSDTRNSSPLLHNEGVGQWLWSPVLSTLGKSYTQSPLGCPTKVQEIHPPRSSSRESMLPHQPTQVQRCPSGHNDRSESQTGASVQG